MLNKFVNFHAQKPCIYYKQKSYLPGMCIEFRNLKRSFDNYTISHICTPLLKNNNNNKIDIAWRSILYHGPTIWQQHDHSIMQLHLPYEQTPLAVFS